MSAVFFGSPRRPLFGFHHAPAGAIEGAVLVCPPWGREYEYAHRALRVLAHRLAEQGRCVFRFDYSGTGDSWGKTTDGDLEQWSDDVATAAEELKMVSGAAMVDLVGLRLGGFLAARHAAEYGDAGRVVLWDPVVDGPSWIREIGRGASAPAPADGEPTTFGSFAVSARFLEQVGAISRAAYETELAPEVLQLVTVADPPRPEGSLEGLPEVVVEHFPQPSPWIEDVSIWAGQIPIRTLDRIVQWLTA